VDLLHLLASSDDYLLEQKLNETVERLCEHLQVEAPEVLADDVLPEGVAVAVCSPSLFSPRQVLVVADARAWVETSAPPGGTGKVGAVDAEPLARALDDGLPDGVALVVAVWCGGQPKGRLVDAVKKAGVVSWIPVPPPPKPWEDVVVSEEQATVLRGVLRRAAGDARFNRAAERLLLERLGFAPRLLAQEVEKLATAAGAAGEVDEELVRRLTFPRERSLEAVRDAILKRDGAGLYELLAAAAAGRPLRGWRGERVDGEALPQILLGSVASLLQQLLYLRRLAAELDIEAEMEPRKTAAGGWYSRSFKGGLAKQVLRHLKNDPASPLLRRGKPPTEWTLGQLFSGAGRYRDRELVASLVGVGSTEVAVRGSLALEAVSGWLARLLPDVGRKVTAAGRR